MVDKLVGQIQETLKSELRENYDKCDLQYASRLVQDADNSKHVC